MVKESAAWVLAYQSLPVACCEKYLEVPLDQLHFVAITFSSRQFKSGKDNQCGKVSG
jgi:hypothetical protein